MGNNLYKTTMTWGLVLGVAWVLVGFASYSMGMIEQPVWLSLLLLLVIAAIVFIGQRKHRDDDLDGYITYGRAFGAGMLVILFGAIIYGFYIIMLVKVIDPTYIDKMLDITAAKLYEMGYDDDLVEQSLAVSARMMSPLYLLISTLFSAAFQGVIISLITSAFVKRTKPMFSNDDADSQ